MAFDTTGYDPLGLVYSYVLTELKNDLLLKELPTKNFCDLALGRDFPARSEMLGPTDYPRILLQPDSLSQGNLHSSSNSIELVQFFALQLITDKNSITDSEGNLRYLFPLKCRVLQVLHRIQDENIVNLDGIKLVHLDIGNIVDVLNAVIQRGTQGWSSEIQIIAKITLDRTIFRIK